MCYTALSFAMDVLKRQKGVFVCKVYRGDQEERLKEKLKLLFGAVRCEKPEASRNVSLFSGLFNALVGGICLADGLDS